MKPVDVRSHSAESRTERALGSSKEATKPSAGGALGFGRTPPEASLGSGEALESAIRAIDRLRDQLARPDPGVRVDAAAASARLEGSSSPARRAAASTPSLGAAAALIAALEPGPISGLRALELQYLVQLDARWRELQSAHSKWLASSGLGVAR